MEREVLWSQKEARNQLRENAEMKNEGPVARNFKLELGKGFRSVSGSGGVSSEAKLKEEIAELPSGHNAERLEVEMEAARHRTKSEINELVKPDETKPVQRIYVEDEEEFGASFGILRVYCASELHELW